MWRKGMVFVVVFGVVVWATGAFAWEVPDTGQTKCYDGAGAEITCPPPGDPMAQDGSYVHRKSYTKLGYAGVELDDDATEWLMVRDDVTKLIWEVKQNKDDTVDYANPNDADNTYTWYDSTLLPDEVAAGTQGDGTNTFDTEQFIKALNDQKFGGFSDWRLPTLQELVSIVDLGRVGPAVETGVFLNTISFDYWSATNRIPDYTEFEWSIHFYNGHELQYYKSRSYYTRAVRSGH